MKKIDFWFLTLCALLVIAGVYGWSLPLRIAVVANATVVLMGVTRSSRALFKTSEEVER